MLNSCMKKKQKLMKLTTNHLPVLSKAVKKKKDRVKQLIEKHGLSHAKLRIGYTEGGPSMRGFSHRYQQMLREKQLNEKRELLSPIH